MPQDRPILPSWASVIVVASVLLTAGFAMWSLAAQNRAMKTILTAAAPAEGVLAAGEVLPAATLTDLQGRSVTLNEVVVEEMAVIAVFTTTCEFCAATLPFWQDLARSFRSRGVAFIGISGHPKSETRAYVEENHINWSVFLADSDAGQQLQILSVPTTLVITRRGLVLASWTGQLSEVEVERIRRLLAADWGSPLSADVPR